MPPARIALAFGPGRQNKSHTIAKLYFPSAIDDNYRNKTEWLSALREGLIRVVHRHGSDWPFFEAEDPVRTGGGSTNKAMAHIAIQEMLGGEAFDWMEPVSEEQYPA